MMDDGEYDIFECLEGHPTRSDRRVPSENLPPGAPPEEIEDIDVFAALRGDPEQTAPPLKKKEKKIPRRLLQRLVWFEGKFKPVDELAGFIAQLLRRHGPQTRRQIIEKVQEYSPGTIEMDIKAAVKFLEEYLEQQGGSLLCDRTLFLDDPYESDLHGTPHR